MSRDFNGTSQYASTTSPPVTGPPFTVSFWVHLDSFADKVAWRLSDNDTGDYFNILLDVSGSDPYIVCVPGFHSSAPTNQMASGKWQHIAVIVASTSSRRIVLNGDWASSGHNTTTQAVTAADRLSFGGGIGADYMDGRIAHAAMWDSALSQAQVEALAGAFTGDTQSGSGANPLAVGTPVAYWPLAGTASPEPDDVASYDLTLTGSPTQGASDPTVDAPPYVVVQSVTFSRTGINAEAYLDDSLSGNGSSTLTPTAGNSLVAFFMFFNATDRTVTFSDALGGNDGWATVGELYDAGSTTQGAIGVLHNAAATSTRVRATLASGAPDYASMVVIEVSGLADVAALDWKAVYQASVGTGTDAVTTGNMGTLSSQPAAIIGASWEADGGVAAPNPGTGYTDGGDIGAYSSSNWTGNWEHKRVTSTAATAATWTNPSGTRNFASFVVALAEATGEVPFDNFFERITGAQRNTLLRM